MRQWSRESFKISGDLELARGECYLTNISSPLPYERNNGKGVFFRVSILKKAFYVSVLDLRKKEKVL